MNLEALVREARACTVCAAHLPHPPRPVLRVGKSARLLIIGQAPGRRVHASGIPWNDPSGQRLRDWLGLAPEVFYDERRVAILPIGLCYPGTVNGADLPPRKECAPLWHPRIVPALGEVRLTLLVGSYAQAFHLADLRKPAMTETVRAFREYLPSFLPLPHPSWRNSGWLKRNAWFEAELVPELRRLIRATVE
ncbi:MAG: uracil-DNA glycosylase family protein [Burkholderiales bacterium]|nr:uracil-DNA glycosylase family protein [Burkholderiales bacterium]